MLSGTAKKSDAAANNRGQLRFIVLYGEFDYCLLVRLVQRVRSDLDTDRGLFK